MKLSNSGLYPAPPPNLPANLRWRLLAALAIATLFELTARVLLNLNVGPSLLSESLSIAAVSLTCISIAVLVARTSGSRSVGLLMAIAASALTVSIVLHICAGIPSIHHVPILGEGGAYHKLVISITDLLGIAAWVFGFFWMVFALQRTRESLDEKHALLLSEIEERKRAETVLRESEGRFRAVFDHVAVGIVTMTPGGVLIACNQDISFDLGYSARHLNGTALDTLVHDSDRASFRDALEALQTSDATPRTFEARLISRDGTAIRFSLTATHIRPDSRHSGTVVALLENITARRLREQQLQQRQKMESLGVLAGGVAHDFNNLLVGIMANAEMLTQDTQIAATHAQSCADIVRSSQRAAELCHQLLAYAGKAPRREQALNLTELAESSQQLLRIALDREATLELECDPSIPAICADPTQIRQVLLSLIANASDALNGELGRITIRTGRSTLGGADLEGLLCRHVPLPGEYVYLEVEDTGVGMAEDAISRIFDPFYTTKHQGSGLGLAAVLGIVHAHQGLLSLRSRPTEGAVFRVYFTPTPREAEPIQTEAAPRKVPADGAIILLVDDEEMVRNAATRILEHSGYQVISAVDGLDGVEKFQQHHTDLAAVLLDLTMPRMNGQTACRRMREIDPTVPIVLSSGYSANESSDPTIFGEVAGYVRKPYRIQQLLDMLTKVTT